MNDSQSVRILSAGAPKTGVTLCAEAWSAESGMSFDIVFATAPVLAERFGTEAAIADLVVAPLPAMEAFVGSGRIVEGSVVPIGEIAAGVVVRAGTAEPDLSSALEFRAALLDADLLVYNRASSGEYIAKMIERLGISDEVAEKTIRVANGAAVMEFLAADTHDRSIGFGQVTEIRLHEDLGVKLVGPLPEEVGKVTAYAAGLSYDAENIDAAAGLLALIGSDEGRSIFAATGVE